MTIFDEPTLLEPSRMRPRFRPLGSKAIVAVNRDGEGCILEHFGTAIAQCISDGAGPVLSDAPMAPPDAPGLWFWEGDGYTVRHSDFEEMDFELRGKYRRLSPEEAFAYNCDRLVPWHQEAEAQRLCEWLLDCLWAGFRVTLDGETCTVEGYGHRATAFLSAGKPTELLEIDAVIRQAFAPGAMRCQMPVLAPVWTVPFEWFKPEAPEDEVVF